MRIKKSTTSRVRANSLLPVGMVAALAAAPLLLPSMARGAAVQGNIISRVAVSASGARTIVTLQGSATASFTAYRLTQPSRLVVEVANSQLRLDSPESDDGRVIAVDTSAVGQVQLNQRAGAAGATTQVLIGLKRDCLYTVRPEGRSLVISLLPADGIEDPVAAAPPANKQEEARLLKREQELLAQKDAAAREAARLALRERELLAQKDAAARAEREADARLALREKELLAQKDTAAREAAARVEKEAAARLALREKELLAQKDTAAREAAARVEKEAAARLALREKELLAQKDAAGAAQREAAARGQAEADARLHAREQELSAQRDALQRGQAELQRRSVEVAAREVKSQAAEQRARELAAQKDALAREQAELSRKSAAQQAELRRAREEAASREGELARRSAVQQAELRQARAEAASREGELSRRTVAQRAAEQRAQELGQRIGAQQTALQQAQDRLGQREQELSLAQRAAEQRAKEVTLAQAAATQREQALATAQWIVSQREQALRTVPQGGPQERDVVQARAAAVQRERELALARASTARREQELLQARETAAQREQELVLAQAAAAQREKELLLSRRDQRQATPPSGPALAEAAALNQKDRARLQSLEQSLRESRQQSAALQQRLLTMQQETKEQQRLLALQAESKKEQQRRATPPRAAAPVVAAAEEEPPEAAPVQPAPGVRRAVTLRSYAVAEEPARGEPEAPRVSWTRAAAPAAPAAVVPVRARGEALLAQNTSGERDSVLVRDVRFEDDGQVARVIIDTAGGAVETSVYSDGRMAVLRLHGAVLARGLTRTLDARAYDGPVQAVSSFADPRARGTVRLVAQLSRSVAPSVQHRGAQIVWEFPRSLASVRFFSPARFAAFGNPPLQAAAALGSGRGTSALAGRRARRYEGRRIDLDFKDADIHNILRLLSEVGQINIITSDDVRGSVTIRMRDVPWDQAMDVILRAKSLGYTREGNLIRVAPQAVLDKEAELDAARLKARVEIEPVQTRLIPISYTDLNKIRVQIASLLSPRGSVNIDDRTNLLIVTDMAGNIALAEDLVRNLDTPTPMVTIEARVVEARASFSRSVGIQWGFNQINSAGTGNPTGLFFPNRVATAGGSGSTPADGLNLATGNPNYLVNFPGGSQALGVALGNAAGTFNLNLRLSAAESTGNIRTINAPKVTTLNNQSANITSGFSIPYVVSNGLSGSTTQFIDATLNLTVKPQVTNDGSVVLQVSLSRSEPDFSVTPPTISRRDIRTNLLIKDGETAVIGGIYTRNVGQSYTKIPWLADIPILGWLFKSRSDNDDRTELLIFLSPRILNRNSALPPPPAPGAVQ